jgi:hypothetical protein
LWIFVDVQPGFTSSPESATDEDDDGPRRPPQARATPRNTKKRPNILFFFHGLAWQKFAFGCVSEQIWCDQEEPMRRTGSTQQEEWGLCCEGRGGFWREEFKYSQ